MLPKEKGKVRGEGIKRIARELGVDRKTVKAWRRRGGWRPRVVGRRRRAVDAFATFIERRAPEVGWNSVVLHREHYDGSLPQEALDSYDATLTAFQRSEKIKEIGWTGAMKTRWRDARSINGRDRIRAVLIELGFKLD